MWSLIDRCDVIPKRKINSLEVRFKKIANLAELVVLWKLSVPKWLPRFIILKNLKLNRQKKIFLQLKQFTVFLPSPGNIIINSLILLNFGTHPCSWFSNSRFLLLGGSIFRIIKTSCTGVYT